MKRFGASSVVLGRVLSGLLLLCLAGRVLALDFDIHFDDMVPIDIQTNLPLALDQWTRVFSDPVTVKLDVRYGGTGSGVTASTQVYFRNIDYGSLTSTLASDADPYESSVIAALPDFNTFQANAYLPADWSRSLISSTCKVTQANALALGLNRNGLWNPYDMTINFSDQAGFWDFNPYDAVESGKVDFYSTAAHEVGHGLGLYSVVDVIDYYDNQGQTSTINPRVVDLFRLVAGEAETVGFTDAGRVLVPGNVTADTGQKYSKQVTWTGLGEIPMSTGSYGGDDYQASHYISQFASPGHYYGTMAPLGALGPLTYSYKQVNANDLMFFGLMGWNAIGWSTDTSLTWNGVGTSGVSGTRWEDSDNWLPYAVPAADHDVFINQTAPGRIDVDYFYAYARDLTLNATGAGPDGLRIHEHSGTLHARNEYIGLTDYGAVQQDAGLNSLTGDLQLGILPGSSGTYALHAGTLAVGGTETVGVGGSGQFIQYWGTHTITGDLVIGSVGTGTFDIRDGSLSVRGVYVGTGSASGSFSISNTLPVITVKERLKLGAHARFSAVSGSTVHMVGADLENESTDPTAVNLSNLTLVFEGGGATSNKLEVAGRDIGALRTGLTDNFALKTLTVGGDTTGNVLLADLFDNGNRVGPVGDAEALYVDSLIVTSGSKLDLASLHLYYGTLVNDGMIMGDRLRTFVPTPTRPGDFDGNGDVGVDDLLLLAEGWGATPADFFRWSPYVDLNSDGTIGMGDYIALADNWGSEPMIPLQEAFALLNAQVAPEPATLLLVASGLATISFRRRRAA